MVEVFPCASCNKIFKNKWNRNRYFDTDHSKKALFECNECTPQKNFTTKIGLEQHKNSVHSENPFFHYCKFCNKAAKNVFNLKSHEKFHCSKNQNQQKNKLKRNENPKNVIL